MVKQSQAIRLRRIRLFGHNCNGKRDMVQCTWGGIGGNVDDLIHAIQLLRGVDNVSIRQKSEPDVSIDEIKNHQVYSANNVDDLNEKSHDTHITSRMS